MREVTRVEARVEARVGGTERREVEGGKEGRQEARKLWELFTLYWVAGNKNQSEQRCNPPSCCRCCSWWVILDEQEEKFEQMKSQYETMSSRPSTAGASSTGYSGSSSSGSDSDSDTGTESTYADTTARGVPDVSNWALAASSIVPVRAS